MLQELCYTFVVDIFKIKENQKILHFNNTKLIVWHLHPTAGCCPVVVGGEAASGCGLAGENSCAGLKCFVGFNVKVNCLEGRACWSSSTRKKVDCPLDYCCCPLVSTWLCCVDWMTWVASIWVSWMVKMYSLAAGAGCCGWWNVCGTNLSHIQFCRSIIFFGVRPDFDCMSLLLSVLCKSNQVLHTLTRRFTTVGEPLPETLLPCFVLEMIISLVKQLLKVLHKVYNSLLIWVCQVCVCHVPLLISWVWWLRCSHRSSSLYACIQFCVTFVCPCILSCHSLLWQLYIASCLLAPSLCASSSLSLACPSSLLCCISADVSPSSHSGTLSLGNSIFHTLLPFLGHIFLC